MKRLWIIFILGLVLFTSCLQQSQTSNSKAGQNSSISGSNSQTGVNTPTPSILKPTKTSLPTIRGCVVNATALFIRSGPGKGFSSVGHFEGGDCAFIKGRNADDTWVMTDKGWVSAYYMDIEGELTELPISSASTPASSVNTSIKTKAPTPRPSPTKKAEPPPTKVSKASPTKAPKRSNCDPSYPDVCIPSPPPDLGCADIPYRRFRVLPPDPHRFDGGHDGIGCER
jgi:uncharacterized protein YraI